MAKPNVLAKAESTKETDEVSKWIRIIKSSLNLVGGIIRIFKSS